jgi:hypothetical protein
VLWKSNDEGKIVCFLYFMVFSFEPFFVIGVIMGMKSRILL